MSTWDQQLGRCDGALSGVRADSCRQLIDKAIDALLEVVHNCNPDSDRKGRLSAVIAFLQDSTAHTHALTNLVPDAQREVRNLRHSGGGDV